MLFDFANKDGEWMHSELIGLLSAHGEHCDCFCFYWLRGENAHGRERERDREREEDVMGRNGRYFMA